MDLRRLIQNTDCQLVRGDALTEVTALCCDSRCAGPGALFVCLPGRHTDGRQFAAQAVAAGITDGTRPRGFATREEVALMVQKRFLETK